MTSSRSVLFGVFAAVSFASLAQAQTTTAASPAVPAAEASIAAPSSEREADRPAGPTIESAVVGARAVPASESSIASDALAQQQGRFGRAETLMIVGGAAFVAGLLIGDDAGTIVMVGGAVMGLYGLYLYLQTQ